MRRALIWLVALAVLGGGAFVGDNLVRDYAENQAEAQIAAELGTGPDLAVNLGGFPFSLALLTRNVPNAAITADSMTLVVEGKELALTDVSVTTGKVTLQAAQIHARNVAGAAELGYPDLEKLAGVPVAYAGDGRLELRYTASVLGQEVSLAVSALPVLDTDEASIRLADPSVEVNGSEFDLPVQQSLIDTLVKPIEVTLEYGLAVTAITPAESGLSLAFGGDTVTIPFG